MNTQQPSRPVITPAMREQAAKQPNTWLYVVDPIFSDPSSEVPPWGFIGGYRVDERGELTEDFSSNPNYRPSPVALRLPAPTNDVERALQLTTTGYAQAPTLFAALLDAELILFAQPQGSGLFTMDHESGRRQLQLFTSEGYLPANWTSWQRMTGRQLVERGPTGMDLQINPTSQVKARIPGEDLIKAAGGPSTPAPPASFAAPSAPV
ncbi:type VII secretion system-associated protein, partial [Saccharopolyspora sp. 6M]